MWNVSCSLSDCKSFTEAIDLSEKGTLTNLSIDGFGCYYGHAIGGLCFGSFRCLRTLKSLL